MEYSTLAARLATFEPPTKRSKIGWPHATPTADNVAKAGFYHVSKGAGSDSATCFMCERTLDGWEVDDDPVQEHLKHSPECAWAILMNITQQSANNISDLEDPTSENIADARRATFTIGWPHDPKRGWVCKTEKMVEAGWHFAPTPESDDFVSCAYCKLSLDGWEPKDNPFDEHYRRSPECPFFAFAGTTAPSKRPKAKKGRASKSSRTSKMSTRLSTQSNMSTMSETADFEPEIDIPDLDESIDTSTVSILSTMSTASTATNKGKRKAGAARKPAKSKKSKTNKPTKAKVTEPEDQEGELPDISQPHPLSDNNKTITPPPRSSSPAAPRQEDAISYPEFHHQPSLIPVQSTSPSGQPRTTPKLPTPIQPITQNPMPEPTKSPSPTHSNSDIENAPPSSRPESIRPPLPPTLISPSIERTEETPSWTPVDVELAFQNVLRSPARTGSTNDGIANTEITKAWINPIAPLSEDEKSMTVQEWIAYLADKAEADLRTEGERVVGVFEREGARAMGVLEGVVCV